MGHSSIGKKPLYRTNRDRDSTAILQTESALPIESLLAIFVERAMGLLTLNHMKLTNCLVALLVFTANVASASRHPAAFFRVAQPASRGLVIGPTCLEKRVVKPGNAG